jgi:hypothetical protein
MKWTLSIEGDYYDDDLQLRELTNLRQVIAANYEARSVIKQMLKHGDPSKDPEAFLERISEMLWVPAIEE